MRCQRCRSEDGQQVTMFANGQVLGQSMLCDDCLADCKDFMADKERQFVELVNAGIDRDDANAIIVAREIGKMPRA